MSNEKLRRTMQAIMPALMTIAIATLILLMASSPTEAVRLRNSLIFDTVEISDLQWKPPDYPATFKLEDHDPPVAFQNAIAGIVEKRLEAQPSFADAIALGNHLAVVDFNGGRIQSDSVTSLDGIVNRGAGYCADFAQVFNGLAHTASLPVREWGMSFGGFNGDGHSFNEVFDYTRDRWIFIDSYFSFYVTDRLSGEPLSVLEFRDRLQRVGGRSSVEVVPISEERFLFGSADSALDYYQRGINGYYVWWGNNVFDYDRSVPVSLAAKVSRSLEEAVAILIGIHPEIRILHVSENESAIDELEKTRARLLVLAIEGAVTSSIVLWQLFFFVGQSRIRVSSD